MNTAKIFMEEMLIDQRILYKKNQPSILKRVPLELHPQGGIFCLAPAGGSNPVEP